MFREREQSAVRPLVSKVFNHGDSPTTPGTYKVLERPGIESVNLVGFPGPGIGIGKFSSLQTVQHRASLSSKVQVSEPIDFAKLISTDGNMPQSLALLDTVGLQPNMWTIPDMLHKRNRQRQKLMTPNVTG